jgi:hypothetical protein
MKSSNSKQKGKEELRKAQNTHRERARKAQIQKAHKTQNTT